MRIVVLVAATVLVATPMVARGVALRISVVRAANEITAETKPELAGLTRQRDVLTTLRQKNCDELLTIAQATDRASSKRIAALKCSIRMIDGRFDLQDNVYPTETRR
jgi:hypothetical protein